MSIQSYLMEQVKKDLDVTEAEFAEKNLALASLEADVKALKEKREELKAVIKALSSIK